MLPDVTHSAEQGWQAHPTLWLRDAKPCYVKPLLTCLSYAGCACLTDGRHGGHPVYLGFPSRLGTNSTWAGTGSELNTRPTISLNERHVGSLDSTMSLARACPSRGWRAAGRYAYLFSLQQPAVTRSSRRPKLLGGIDATHTLTTQTRNAYSTNATDRGRHSQERHSHARDALEHFSERYSLERYLWTANHSAKEKRARPDSIQRVLVDKLTLYATYATQGFVPH